MLAVKRVTDGVVAVEVDEPARDGVHITVRAAGICSTDLSMLSWGPSPITLGHEFAGVTDDGVVVAVEPIAPCGACDQCRSGAYNRCERGIEIYLGIGADGGMAERARVPADALVPLPSSVRVEDASLVEPIAVARHGVRLVGITSGQRVAVVGAGPIGLLAAAVAIDTGASVAVAARHSHQQAAAERIGATVGPMGAYDVVIDAAGTSDSLTLAADLAAPGGALLLLATSWDKVELPGLPLMTKELRTLTTMAYNRVGSERDFDSAAALLAARPELADAIVTHRFPLADAAEAFRVAADRAAGAIKVVLEP